ncbi:MAG: VOC family protein, partial [Flavobacteriales bacterium]|nr:VOC family protein [Flavobacteriales bacterium]
MGGTTSNKRKKEKTVNCVSWFEIPALNFEQALNFYNNIFETEMEKNINGNYAMAFFPVENGVGGAIVAGPGSTPGDSGPLIYLNAGHDFNTVLNRVESAGGRVVMPKTFIG